MDTKTAGPIIIQSNEVPNKKSKLPFSLSKTIFTVLGLVIVGELIWGGFYLLKAKESRPTNKVSTAISVPPSSTAQINLASAQADVKVGDTFDIDILITGNNSKVVGLDLSLKYDPNLVSVDTKSFLGGELFTEYLGFSNAGGFLKVSGLADPSVKLSGSQKFGRFIFKAKASGNAKFNIDFTPNNTKDTNIIDEKSGRDILDKVTGLTIRID